MSASSLVGLLCIAGAVRWFKRRQKKSEPKDEPVEKPWAGGDGYGEDWGDQEVPQFMPDDNEIYQYQEDAQQGYYDGQGQYDQGQYDQGQYDQGQYDQYGAPQQNY